MLNKVNGEDWLAVHLSKSSPLYFDEMDKKEIIFISHARYHKLKKLIEQTLDEFNKDTIHELRVEYKKLRAFFRMISHGMWSGRKIKLSGKLKKVYSLSGSLRDLQLQRARILESLQEEIRKPLFYLNILTKEMENLERDLSAAAGRKLVGKSKNKTDAAIPNQFRFDDYRSFIKEKWSKTDSIVAMNYFSDNNIHTIRKNLKDLFYNLKYYTKNDPSILPATIWNGKDEKFITELMDEMGEFQDKCTAILLIKMDWLNRLDRDERNTMVHLKKAWMENKINLKQRIIQKLKLS